MARTSPVYYIAPSAISIVPNANGSKDDLAVYVARGARIKVYEPTINELDLEDAVFQEWSFRGRNRRLAEGDKPYTIYARLRKESADGTSASWGAGTDAHDDGYLVFAPQVLGTDGKWHDPYVLSPNTSSTGGMRSTDNRGIIHTWQPIPAKQAEDGRQDYWWVKVGVVSAPEEGQRAVDLDTGILGTDEYNTGWKIDPDALPTRVDISNSYGTDIPSVPWDGEITVFPSLIAGFNTDISSTVDHWTVSRSTGDDESDRRWNDGVDTLPEDIAAGDSDSSSSSSEDEPSGGYGRIIIGDSLLLQHMIAGPDDFSRSASATFTFTAWSAQESDSSSSDSSSSESPEPLASGSITILAESAPTRERTYSEWIPGTRYYYRTLNPERDPVTGMVYIETSYVWHNGKLWMCLRSLTTDEPSFDSADWKMVAGGTFALGFYTEGDDPTPILGLAVRPANVDEKVVPYLLSGQEDISGSVTSWTWERESAYPELDEAWKNSAHVDPDDPESPLKSVTRMLHITNDDLPTGWDADGGNVAFKCTATFPLGGDDAEIMNRISIV